MLSEQLCISTSATWDLQLVLLVVFLVLSHAASNFFPR